MNHLSIAENIVRLRHMKKLTQEQVAELLGVTKASVSKWETGQSMPDIMMLPKLASFFGTTIDELMGYEPQLTEEQEEKIYLELCEDFANKPFADAYKNSKEYVRQYYSCYSFLHKISLLWINHYMLVDDREEQLKVLLNASQLCKHVADNSMDIGLCSDATVTDAMILFQMGKPDEVVDILEEICNPIRLSRQADGCLISSYQMMGEIEKAYDFAQVNMYTQLLNVISNATIYLDIKRDNISLCEETIRRIATVIELYSIQKLNPNSVAVFYLQAAIMYASNNIKDKMLLMLEKYADAVNAFFEREDLSLHGDEYFDRLDTWKEKISMKGKPPRHLKVIFESALSAFSLPIFVAFSDDEEFKKIKNRLEKRGE